MRWTVELGNNIDNLRLAIENKNIKIGKCADCLINSSLFLISKEVKKISLVTKSVSELGFNEGANFDQICKAANEIGLSKCPMEVGPLLRSIYLNQPIDEWLVIAMDSIIDSEGNPRMFLVGCNRHGRWLVGDFGFSEHIYGKNKKFVFIDITKTKIL